MNSGKLFIVYSGLGMLEIISQPLGGGFIQKSKHRAAGARIRDRGFPQSLGSWAGSPAFWSFQLLIHKVAVTKPSSGLLGKANKTAKVKTMQQCSLASKNKESCLEDLGKTWNLRQAISLTGSNT